MVVRLHPNQALQAGMCTILAAQLLQQSRVILADSIAPSRCRAIDEAAQQASPKQAAAVPAAGLPAAAASQYASARGPGMRCCTMLAGVGRSSMLL